MMYWNILCCTSLFYFNAVQGWSCVSTPTQVYSKLNTNAVLPFDISADLIPSNSITYSIIFYDETVVAAVRYEFNGNITPQAIKGYSVTADAAGKVELTIQNVGNNNKGIYFISGGNSPERCTCLYILGVPTKATVSVSNNPSVGGSATLTCRSTSTASPSNHSLTFMYNWKVDNVDNPTGSRYSYSSNRNTLTLSQLVKDDVNKQFTCTAKEHVTDGYTSSSSDSVTLYIHYGPENITFTPSAISYERSENTSLRPITCTANCNPPCSFRWNKIGQNPAISNNANLNIGVLSSTDTGVYRCTTTRSGASPAGKDLTVKVIYGPRNMIFTPAGTSYRYNENYNPPPISCSSDCYLCNYSWAGPNSYTHSGQVLDLGSLQRSMDGQYMCTVTNSKLSSQNTQSKQVKIEVRYGPDSVNITPSNSSYTVDEETILPNIRCKADCFPVCTYRWTKEGQTEAVSNTDVLPLGTVKKNFARKYTCTATNGELPKTLNTHVVINVRYGPYASSTVLAPSAQEYIHNENGQVLPDIRCSADCYPHCTYSWTKTKQGEITTVSTTSVLSLGSLKRLDAANYTCIATNPGKLNSPQTTKYVVVKVRYGPDNASVSVQSPYTVTEGDQPTDVICSSDCYPRCTYRWTNSTSSAPIGTNGALSLQTVNRYMAGAYKCTSSNAAAEYSKDVDSTLDVIVRYAPDVSLRFSTTNVTEGSTLTLYCNGAGVPTTYTYISLTQTLNGIQIQNRNTAAGGSQDHSSIYFLSLHWHDTGTYTCTLNNGVKDITGVLPQSGSVNLYVKVQPKVLDDDLRFTGVTGGTVKLQIPIYSLPETDRVEITRYDGQPISIKAEKYNITSLDTDVNTSFYETPVSLNGNMISFMIFNLEENDFGNYTLTMKNEIGVTDVYVFVIAEGPPSIPKGLYFQPDDKSLTFIWEKNFNGGQKQTFVLQTSIAESNNWINQTDIHEDDTVHKVNGTFYTAIVSLDPGVYEARIFSHNAKGHSEFVELGYTFKVVKEENDTTQKLPIGGIAGGVGAAVVVFGIVAVVLFSIKRRQQNKDGSTTKLKSSSSHGVDDDDDEDEVNTVNPMYVSADEVPPTDNTYAQPIKKKKVVAEHGDLYAMVDKKPKSQPKDGDIYENAPEVAKKDKKKKTSKGKGKAYEENPYEDPGTTTNNKPRRNVNKYGLIYADLTFNDQPKGQKKLVIHGLDSMTEYVEVDFSKKADPLPDSDEENCESKN